VGGMEGSVDSSCVASIMQAAFKSLGVFNCPIQQVKHDSQTFDQLFGISYFKRLTVTIAHNSLSKHLVPNLI